MYHPKCHKKSSITCAPFARQLIHKPYLGWSLTLGQQPLSSGMCDKCYELINGSLWWQIRRLLKDKMFGVEKWSTVPKPKMPVVPKKVKNIYIFIFTNPTKFSTSLDEIVAEDISNQTATCLSVGCHYHCKEEAVEVGNDFYFTYFSFRSLHADNLVLDTRKSSDLFCQHHHCENTFFDIRYCDFWNDDYANSNYSPDF